MRTWAVSPASVWRVLKQAELLSRWKPRPSRKSTGFEQPLRPHQHWHVDVSYINLSGKFYYLCSVLDGCSRFLVHWDLRRAHRGVPSDLCPHGRWRVELDNINGPVHISSWDQNQVKVDAVKYADTKERLDEAKIEIDSKSNAISIRTRYPDHNQNWNWGSHNNPASVEYTLTVPRTARLDEIKLINGELDITGVSGEVRASCINGRLEAQNLAGHARLSTINGHLDAKFDKLDGKSVELNSVNGSVDLTIPSDSNAEVEASTVSGSINNDFGLHVNNHRFVGHDLRGELGSGGTRITVSNVNGRVEVRHAQDGHAMSPVKDLSHRDKDDDDDTI